MGDSIRSPSPARVALPRAALAGGALGGAALSGASLVLYESSGLLSGATGVVATLLVSLLVGIWAGAPAAEADEPPLRERWVGAGMTAALAGVLATLWNLYDPLAFAAFGRVLGLLVMVAAPAYAVGMLLPALLVWSERLADAEEPEEGWGAVGGLVLGLLGGLAAGVLLSGLLLIPWLGPGPLMLGISVALLAPLVFPDPERLEPEERLIHEEASPFGVLRVTEVVFAGERQPERRLYLNDEQESGELVRSGAPTLAYIAAAEGWLVGNTPPGGAYLFLGGGAYTLPRRVAERDPRARVTVVELDPAVTRIAYRFFGLRRDHGVASVHGDARAYLDRPDEARFDRVYLDVYAGQESLPYSLVTAEAFAAMLRRLRPGGVAAVNLIGTASGPESPRLWSVVRTMAEVFPSIALYWHLGPDFPDRQNLLLAGAADPDFAFPARAGLFELWPREQWPEVEQAMVLRDLFPAAAPVRPAGERVNG
jgi:SAM-dependent methyltransferase